jgi:UDP-N-acetylmuramoylalanine--D-glutamate ligase
MEFQNKKILILGLAKSGFEALKLLLSRGANIVVSDKNNEIESEVLQFLNKKNIPYILGEHPLSLLENVDFIVKNPGIPYSIDILKEAKNKNIPIITEIELSYHITNAEFIGITGSNGKTTTTTLVYEFLQSSNKKPLIAGNIGQVACGVAQQANEENLIVTELSSFQLMGISEFKPKVALFLNIYEAHLDYHGSLCEYVEAKRQLIKNQSKDDYFIYNFDNEFTRKTSELSLARNIPFSVKTILNNGVYVLDGFIYFNDEKIVEISSIALPGEHNLENILAAIAVAKIYHVANEDIKRVLTHFTGVKHRLQFVKSLNNRLFYNDSKATNIESSKRAVNSFKQPVILLAGGLDRGINFNDLFESSNIKSVFAFGQTKDKICNDAYRNGVFSVSCENLSDAIQKAYSSSQNADVILLSPACASWDQYKSFEDRGDEFINFVNSL